VQGFVFESGGFSFARNQIGDGDFGLAESMQLLYNPRFAKLKKLF